MNTGFHFEEDMDLFIMEMQDMPVILALMAAAVAVEIFLAVKKDGRLGLALPGLWLLRCVVQAIVWMVQVSGYSSVAAMGGTLAVAFLVENIPALLLLAVYGLCRLCKRWKTVQQVKKTRIQEIGRAHV